MDKIKETLNGYSSSCELVATTFTKKYFDKGSENYWVAQEVGSVFYINDRFFSVHDMVDFLRYKYSSQEMFRYYDEALDYHLKAKNKGGFPNIKNYLKIKK